MKSWAKSKSVWINMLTLAAGVIGYVAGHEVIAEYPTIVAALVAVLGGVNVALRFVTWQPIK